MVPMPSVRVYAELTFVVLYGCDLDPGSYAYVRSGKLMVGIHRQHEHLLRSISHFHCCKVSSCQVAYMRSAEQLCLPGVEQSLSAHS